MRRAIECLDAAIECLERFERIPGEYFVLRIEKSQILAAERVLLSAGVHASADLAAAALHMPEHQRHKPLLFAGDYVTFRRRVLGRWSVITYGKSDFERRYRRISDAAA